MQGEQNLKITGNDNQVQTASQGLSGNNISHFSEMNSWKHFSGDAILLVPTAICGRFGPEMDIAKATLDSLQIPYVFEFFLILGRFGGGG